jgi:hypothetical protein
MDSGLRTFGGSDTLGASMKLFIRTPVLTLLFGLGAFAQAGGFTLNRGKSITHRQHVVFHNGDDGQAKIAEAYKAYAKEK